MIDLNDLARRLQAGEELSLDELKDGIAAMRAGRASAATTGAAKSKSKSKAASAAAMDALMNLMGNDTSA